MTEDVGSVNESGSTGKAACQVMKVDVCPLKRTFIWEKLVCHDPDPFDDLYARQEKA